MAQASNGTATHLEHQLSLQRDPSIRPFGQNGTATNLEHQLSPVNPAVSTQQCQPSSADKSTTAIITSKTIIPLFSAVIGHLKRCPTDQKRRMLMTLNTIATVPMASPRPLPIPLARPAAGRTHGKTT